MITRFFLLKGPQNNQAVIDKFNELTKLRETELDKLKEEFDLVGFIFGNNGRPDYFLKELGSDFDESKFRSSVVTRAGNSFLALEPEDFSLCDRLSVTFTPTLAEAGKKVLLREHGIHLFRFIEAKQVEGLVLIKVKSGLSYKNFVDLVELTEDQYNNPYPEKLKLLI